MEYALTSKLTSGWSLSDLCLRRLQLLARMQLFCPETMCIVWSREKISLQLIVFIGSVGRTNGSSNFPKKKTGPFPFRAQCVVRMVRDSTEELRIDLQYR